MRTHFHLTNSIWHIDAGFESRVGVHVRILTKPNRDISGRVLRKKKANRNFDSRSIATDRRSGSWKRDGINEENAM